MKLQGTSENRRWFAPAATVLCLATAVSPSFAFGKNLIVNGTFDSGSLSPWTRNTTKGSKNNQGNVAIYAAGASGSWVHASLAAQCGSRALVLQSYNYPADSYGTSADTYVTQSVVVEDAGTYLVSFDYAGRNHNQDKYWTGAEGRVRIYKGTDLAATPVFEGSFTPLSKEAYARYSARTRIAEPGTYTIQVILPIPTVTGGDNCDKAVVVDNVAFALDDSENLVVNGRFEASENNGTAVLSMYKDQDNASTANPGFQQGAVNAGFSNPGWNAAGPVGLTMRGMKNAWVANIRAVGTLACYMQTYHYANNTYSNSTDACIWQSFEVHKAGSYRLAFDYAGRADIDGYYGAPLRVRLYKGTDRTAEPFYEGPTATPFRKSPFSRYIVNVPIQAEDVGTYTLEFFQAQPATASRGGDDKAICIDNVEFKLDDNLVKDGYFDQVNPPWQKSGSVNYNNEPSWVSGNLPFGNKAVYLQTYWYSNQWGKSADASLWQSFTAEAAGIYELAFDYAGRAYNSLFGATAYARIRTGDGTGGTIVYEQPVVPATAEAYTHSRGYVNLPAAGTYTVEFFQAAPTAVGEASSDKAIILDNVVVRAAGFTKIARWTGAVDDDAAKPGNWEGGTAPDAETLAYFTGEFAARIPSGSAFTCAGVVFAENAKLAQSCDWSGLGAVEMTGSLDVNGNRLTLSAFQGSASVSSGVPGGVLEIATPAAADLAVNSSVVILGGNVRVEKTGAGTFISKTAQTYSGGTVVIGGTARPIDPPADDDTLYGCGNFPMFGSGRIEVRGNATLDVRGQYGFANRIDLAGGTLACTGYGMALGNTASGSGVGRVLADSRVVVENAHLVFGERGGETDLCGNVLEMDITGRIRLHNSVVSNGTLNIVRGGYLQTISGIPVDASTVDVKANCAFWLDAPLTVRDYEAIYPADYNQGTSALNVCGTFTPRNAYFYGCTMQDGSAIDLSGREGTWATKSAFTTGTNVVTFAAGANVTVNLAGRSDLKSLANSAAPYVIDWTNGVKPGEGVSFVLDPETRRLGYSVKMRDNGLALLLRRGFMLIVR